MNLSLSSKTMLMAFDTDKERLFGRKYLAIALRAAVLTELTIAGLLADAGHGPVVASESRPRDAFLAAVLDDIGAGRHSWRRSVRRHRSAAHDRARDDLVARGILERRPRGGLVVSAANAAFVRDLRGQVVELLRDPTPARQVGREDAALLGLAAAGRLLRRHVPVRELRRRRDRVAALSARAGTPVVEAAKAVRRSRAAAVAVALSGTHGG